MYFILCISLLLTFSYKLVEIIISKTNLNRVKKHTVLLWAVFIMLSVPLFYETYLFKRPMNLEKALPILCILILLYIVSARFSGYNPRGKYNIINFIMTYPIIEEIIFRGLMLPNLNQVFGSTEVLQVVGMPVTLPVLVSASLFGICHLQYYRLTAESMKFVILAFLGGILLGAMTVMTQSIVFALFLHIVFNLFAVLFAQRKSKAIDHGH